MACAVCFSQPGQAYGGSLAVKRELCQSWECVLRLPKAPWACRSFDFVSCLVTRGLVGHEQGLDEIELHPPKFTMFSFARRWQHSCRVNRALETRGVSLT